MKISKQQMFLLLTLLTFLAAGCSNILQPSEPEPTPDDTAEEIPVTNDGHPIGGTEKIEARESTDEMTAEEMEDNTVDDFLQQVISEATILRTDGNRLLEENNLEEARQALDESLNVILNSGLALDAHPELAELFKDITKEVVRVEDSITDMENGVEETPLVDELESIEIDSEELADLKEEKKKEESPAVTYDIPVVQNARVEYFIKKFTTTHRNTIEAGIQRSGQFIDRFREILKEEGVPQDLVYLAMIESTFKVRAYSRAKAKGIWQFMSWTGKRYGLRIDWWVDERSNPFKACRSAARYLRELYDDLGHWHLAMAAYNGGPGRVGKAIKRVGSRDFWELAKTRHLRRETRNFVPSILAVTIIMKQPEVYGFGNVKLDQPWSFDTVNIASPIDLRVVAELAGTKVDDIRALNPSLRRMITPQDYKNFSLRVPVGTGENLTLKLASLPASKRLKYAEHLIHRGDTLSGIAERYGSSVRTIMTANNITNPRRLKPGQVVIVPLSPGYSPEQRTTSSSYDQGEKLVHVVRRGDSLYKIARRYGTTVGSIASWNNMNSRQTIHPGNKLTVYARMKVGGTSGGSVSPTSDAKTLYTVKQGDTLYDIAIRYNTTVKNLKQWNNLRRNLIKPGDKLTLYLKGSS